MKNTLLFQALVDAGIATKRIINSHCRILGFDKEILSPYIKDPANEYNLSCWFGSKYSNYTIVRDNEGTVKYYINSKQVEFIPGFKLA